MLLQPQGGIDLTGNIQKDFENYLIEAKLWDRWKDNPTKWIDRIGEKMERAIHRTGEENKSLTEDDLTWWIKLAQLQNYYGPERDIFGEYLELTNMTSQKNGQFFTPMSVCKIMSMITYSKPTKKPTTVSDCACGSGRMMIAHSIVAQENRDNPHNFCYYNQDIDYKSFIFTTLNAVLRNLASVNVWGDTLAMTKYKTYITIPSSIGYATWHDESIICGVSRKVG